MPLDEFQCLEPEEPPIAPYTDPPSDEADYHLEDTACDSEDPAADDGS